MGSNFDLNLNALAGVCVGWPWRHRRRRRREGVKKKRYQNQRRQSMPDVGCRMSDVDVVLCTSLPSPLLPHLTDRELLPVSF